MPEFEKARAPSFSADCGTNGTAERNGAERLGLPCMDIAGQHRPAGRKNGCTHRKGLGTAASIAAAVLMFLLPLAGCAFGSQPERGDKPLVVATSYTDSFYDLYGDYLNAAYPDMTFDVIEMKFDYGKSNMEEQVRSFMEREKPDLLLPLSYADYVNMADYGLLENLSSRMLDSGMKEEDFQPGVIERLKQNAGGQIYGLAPFFQISVLAYNEDLFVKYAIEPPHNGMTMREIYDLAGRFADAGADEDGIVGFHQSLGSMPSSQLLLLANNEGVQPYNFTSGKMTMDTPIWKTIFHTVVELYESGALLAQNIKPKVHDGVNYYDKEAVTTADLFKQGKAAMTLASYGQYADSSFKSGQAAPPVSMADPMRTYYMQVYNLMCIRSGSPNADEAWKAIRFMNSDYVAKVTSKLKNTSFSSLQSYRTYNTDPLVGDLFALHAVQLPVPSGLPPIDMKAAVAFDDKLAEMENDGIAAVVNGERSLDDVMADIQKQGQVLFSAMLNASAAAAK